MIWKTRITLDGYKRPYVADEQPLGQALQPASCAAPSGHLRWSKELHKKILISY